MVMIMIIIYLVSQILRKSKQLKSQVLQKKICFINQKLTILVGILSLLSSLPAHRHIVRHHNDHPLFHLHEFQHDQHGHHGQHHQYRYITFSSSSISISFFSTIFFSLFSVSDSALRVDTFSMIMMEVVMKMLMTDVDNGNLAHEDDEDGIDDNYDIIGGNC